MLELLHVLAFVLGAALVLFTVGSAVRTFVLPRSAPERIARFVFLVMRRLFDLRARRARTYSERDAIMAGYTPYSLIALPGVWLALVAIGYSGMFWALGVPAWDAAFTTSGSSLLTLGFAQLGTLATTILAFSEATIGLFLVALLIAYLPTMYQAFNKREVAVTRLEVRRPTSGNCSTRRCWRPTPR